MVAHLLHKTVSEDPAAAFPLKIMTCYGMQMGSSYPLKILKLVMDFENSLCDYEEQFCLHLCAVYPAYIDIGLSYIIQRL